MTNKARELLPCPFCGGEAWFQDVHYEDDPHIYFQVNCLDCDFTHGLVMSEYEDDHTDAHEELTKLWNTRPTVNLYESAHKQGMKDGLGKDINVICNKICDEIPSDCVISLCLENGAAWVELGVDFGGTILHINSADKTLIECLNEALEAAKSRLKEDV